MVLVLVVAVAVAEAGLALSCWASGDRRLLLLTAFFRRPSAERRGAGEGERPMPSLFLKRASKVDLDLDFFERKLSDALRRVEEVFPRVPSDGWQSIALADFVRV